MKILIYSQYFWPESFSINELAKSLLGKGLNVEVLTGKPNYPRGEIFAGYCASGCQLQIHEGIKINRIPLLPRGRGGLRLVLNYLSFVVSGIIFAPWLLRNKSFDVIFVYAPSPILQALSALFLGWLKRIPVVLNVQDLWPESLSATGYVRNRTILKLVGSLTRFIYRHTDLLLVQSKAFEKPIRALAPYTRIAYYPNSVDGSFTDSLSQDVILPDVPALDEGFAVVFAGNVGAGQAVEVMVEAAELLRDFPKIRFVVFGEGSRLEWMREQVQARGLTNLHLPGRFPVNTMPGLMQKSGALLVTLADEPIFAMTVPNKVQAYMAAGRPILACLNGEGADLVAKARAGLSVPAQDSKALAAAVLRLYRMPAKERAHLGANGRRYFKTNFDHDKLVDELIAHLRTMSKTVEETV